MATRRGHELANGGGFTAEAHAMRRFLRVASRPGRRRHGRGLLPSPPVTPLVVIAAGFVAIAIGSLLLRSYGPRFRVGRLLAVTPTVSIAAARELASTARQRYVRVDGRLDADEIFPDEHDRPLVFRRTRIEARLRGGWRVIDERREAVAFRVRDGVDEIGIDAEAIEDGLVTLVRESTGTAAEVAGQLTQRLAPETKIRLRIEHLSSVEHAVVLGMPLMDLGGAVRMTRGTGRPLVVCTLEEEEAMRVLTDGARARPVAAAVTLAGGLALLVAGIGWALVVGSGG